MYIRIALSLLLAPMSAYACDYGRVSPVLPITLTALPVVLLGVTAYWLLRRQTKQAKITARVLIVLAALALCFCLFVTWSNTLGWVSPCADWGDIPLVPEIKGQLGAVK